MYTASRADPVAQADKLFKFGVLVTDPNIVDSKLLEETGTNIEAYREYLQNQPEFKKGWNVKTDPIVMGGFGAAAHPSSFHHKAIRRIRLASHKESFLMYLELARREGFSDRAFLYQVYDRILHRTTEQSPTAESWHRDRPDAASTGSSSLVTGGWINLNEDESPQYFQCIPGTHRKNDLYDAGSKDGNGFSKFSPEQIANLGLVAKSTTIEIPYGHQIIFYENIIHNVVSGKPPSTMDRMFLGFVLSSNSMPTKKFEEMMIVIDTLGVPRLKSGQMPAILPKTYVNFHVPYKAIIANFAALIADKYIPSKRKMGTDPRSPKDWDTWINSTAVDPNDEKKRIAIAPTNHRLPYYHHDTEKGYKYIWDTTVTPKTPGYEYEKIDTNIMFPSPLGRLKKGKFLTGDLFEYSDHST
jgi:hypothetical protein